MRVLAFALLLLSACVADDELGADAAPDAGSDAAPACTADETCPELQICVGRSCEPCGAEGQACCRRPLVTWCNPWCDGGTCSCVEGTCR